MKIEVRKQFVKDKIFNFVENVKLKWFENYYRVRLWDYRVWIKKEKQLIIFERVLNRKDIYKVYP